MNHIMFVTKFRKKVEFGRIRQVSIITCYKVKILEMEIETESNIYFGVFEFGVSIDRNFIAGNLTCRDRNKSKKDYVGVNLTFGVPLLARTL